MVSHAGFLAPSRSVDSGPAKPLPLGSSCAAWFCLLRFCRLQGATAFCGCCLRAAGPLPGLLLLHGRRRQGCDRCLHAAGWMQCRGAPASSCCRHGVLHCCHASRQAQHWRHHHSPALIRHADAATRCRRDAAHRLAPVRLRLHIARPWLQQLVRWRHVKGFGVRLDTHIHASGRHHCTLSQVLMSVPGQSLPRGSGTDPGANTCRGVNQAAAGGGPTWGPRARAPLPGSGGMTPVPGHPIGGSTPGSCTGNRGLTGRPCSMLLRMGLIVAVCWLTLCHSYGNVSEGHTWRRQQTAASCLKPDLQSHGVDHAKGARHQARRRLRRIPVEGGMCSHTEPEHGWGWQQRCFLSSGHAMHAYSL